MATNHRRMRGMLLAATALTGGFSVAMASAAAAQERSYQLDLPAQSLSQSLMAFGSSTDQQIVFSEGLVRGRAAPQLKGDYTAAQALALLLSDTGLVAQRNADGVVLITRAAADPQSGSAAGDGAEVEALIVTAQKREEDIQDVPIAISAFSQEDLTRSQVAGGPDLITQVPNMTFTKTNFSSYSVQIRGIGTQAISATTDPAVAVAFNNTPFIRNRFFEQEFYDLQRVEVLRGPQGTLYGRNATAGVVNIISAKPKFIAEAKLSGDVSNFNSTRLEGMLNIPLVEDAVALRIAGAWTKRDGYATNELTGNPIDGRDLWSTRVSLRFAPPDGRMDLNLIWEHFEENDDRLRSGKQLCDKDVITEFSGVPITSLDQRLRDSGQAGFPIQSSFSTGCERNSLYSPESFQTVMGLSVPYYYPMSFVGLPIARLDPYVNTVQSPDLRVIESTVDPDYRAKTDIAELQISFDLTDDLTLTSETAYATDWVWSMQDFNRFNTAPGAWGQGSGREGAIQPGPNGGIFCDPQLGCSDRLVAVDLSTAEYWQFSQEFRLASDYDGSFNFSLGANFLKTDGEDKYYVFINSLSLGAATILNRPMPPYEAGVTDNRHCLLGDGDGFVLSDPAAGYGYTCVYIDPNPIGSLNDQGHNYFLSKNPYTLHSYAVFGEAYYNIAEDLKVTAGLRWSVDRKRAPRIPSQAFNAASYGYPVLEVEEQEWREPTGRLVVDWKPDLAFTDETLVYASYAHGYKAGGSNPPVYAGFGVERSATRPKTFDPEFVDAYEVGSKNTLLDGTVTVNLAAFYYDYTGYQISEIVDRSAFNRNFDAEVWGAEIEADWRPLENLRLGFKGGYQNTRIADGERAIDLMDRTAGRDDWVVVRPFPTRASSCVVPRYIYLVKDGQIYGPGSMSGGGPAACELAYEQGLDPVTNLPYVANPTQAICCSSFGSWPAPGTPGAYPGFNPFDESQGHNFGEGFFKELGGNELPNAPNWTGTITADYTIPLPNEWLVNLHTDLHWQAESWWRVFNDHEFSKLDEYFTMNLAAIFTNEERGWNIMAYIKNVTDETAITGAFLNSDDTGLTTNVFLTEPRLYGLRVTKAWTGGPTLGSFGQRRDGPYPFTVEIGGQVQRHDAPYDTIRPAFVEGLDPVLDVFGQEQHQDLDWGDGREVKLTWRPSGDWKVSAGLRVGKANNDATKARGQYETEEVCGFAGYYAAYICPYANYEGSIKYLSQTNWLDSTARSREEHQIVDFAVGRDLGIGTLGENAIDLGIRYAKLQSKTNLHVDADTEWYLPQGWLVPGYYQVPGYFSRHIWREADLESNREFEGAGPVLSWAASTPLLGSNEAGHLRLDWGAAGGVLFGKQRTTVTGSEIETLYEPFGGFAFRGYVEPTSITETPVNISRSDSATVPVLDLSIGVSYAIGGASIGAGYRWERYFDAVDAGLAEQKSYDRTLDGPYFKLSVGFGG